MIDCMDRNHPSVIEKKQLRTGMTGKFHSEEIVKPAQYRDIPRKYKRYGIPLKVFTEDLEKTPPPQIIMVTSALTYWYPGVHMAISIVKEKFPGIPVILGGIYATLCTDFARENSGADIIFEGSNMKKLMNSAGEITDTVPAFCPENFKEFPFPDFSVYKKLDYATLITSVGCPYRCTYCVSYKLQPEYIALEPEKIVNEIHYLTSSYKISHIAFYDDALLVNKDRHIIPVLKTLIKEERTLNFYTPNGIHARFIDRETAELMKKAGFKIINLSLETVNEKMQKDTGNKVTNRDMEIAVENLFRAGFSSENIRLYTLMGLPGQTFEEVDETIDYIFSLRVQSRLSPWSPVPGTCEFEKIKGKYSCDLSDPLYHNVTYHYYLGEWLDLEERKYLKDRADRQNKNLEKC